MFIIFSIIKVQNYKYSTKKANNLLNLLSHSDSELGDVVIW